MARRLYLVAYDIAAPRRLRAALDLVKGHATGGQKSAYECWLTGAEKSELLHELSRILDEVEDTALVIDLDPRAAPLVLGIAETPIDPEHFYLH